MDTPHWVTDAIFYEIFPDRFARSESVPKGGLNLEEWESPPTVYGFKGGDLRGVIEHLDHIEGFGANAIYFTPVFASAANHRYQTYDYFHVDPLLGGNEALRDLLDQAHERGFHVILDGVFNHASRGFWQFHHTLENGAASPYVDWFHFDEDRLQGRRNWGAYPTPDEQAAIGREGSYRAIGYQGWWNMPGLPKFNTGSPAVREFLLTVAEHWVRFGIDGWRLDVPGEINDASFWQEFRGRVRSANPEAYIVGEEWHDARRWLQGDQFDASMNYSITAACLGFVTGDHLDLEETLRAGGYQGMVQSIDARAFADRVEHNLGLYHPDVSRVQLNLLDSHDTPRFLTSAKGDADSVKLALTFIFGFPGAPCLYYGDEIGLEGRQDPDNRRAFPWDSVHWNHELLEFVKSLASIRKARRSLRWGDHRTIHAEAGCYAMSRTADTETTLVFLNASGEPREISLPPRPAGSTVQSLLGAADVLAGSGGAVRVPARSGAILAADGAA